MIKACGACWETYSEDLLETHHKVPQYLNGSDDPENLVDICPICHTSIHKVVGMLKKNPGKASAFLYENYGDDQRIHTLIIQLAKVIIYEEENSPDKDYVNVFLKVPKETHRVLSDLSKLSKINMHDYIISLIDREGRRSQERGSFTLRRR
jgi:hypothetical protein